MKENEQSNSRMLSGSRLSDPEKAVFLKNRNPANELLLSCRKEKDVVL